MIAWVLFGFPTNSTGRRAPARRASRSINVARPSYFTAWQRATVSASDVELEVEPCQRTAQVMAQRRPVFGLRPKVDFVSSESPRQSASDHITSCTSCRSQINGRKLRVESNRTDRRKVGMQADQCGIARGRPLNDNSARTLYRNNSVTTWLDALEENLPGSSLS